MTGLPEFSGVLTFPSTGKPAALVYVPYLQSIEREQGDRFLIRFNGGEISVDLPKIECMLFYGASGAIPLEFLDAANRHRVPLTFHRTHQAEPYVLMPTAKVDLNDVLTAQILAREDGRRRLYIARQFIAARLQGMTWLEGMNPSQSIRAVRAARHLDAILHVEADATRRYWSAYYEAAGLAGLARRDDHVLNQALDSGSRFLAGIVLRWTLFHKLSPSHGFMHRPSNYIALVYDALEPYRTWIERACLMAWNAAKDKSVLAASVDTLKRMMVEAVFVPATRQTVRRKALLHGIVLALRAYLKGDMHRFVVPQEGKLAAGRPIRASYRLIGEVR
jgi:CRISPR/Cas system-associated endonuclease Cas1